MYKTNPLMKKINEIGYIIENKENTVKFTLRSKSDIVYTVSRIATTMYSIEDTNGGKGFMSMKNVVKYVSELA